MSKQPSKLMKSFVTLIITEILLVIVLIIFLTPFLLIGFAPPLLINFISWFLVICIVLVVVDFILRNRAELKASGRWN